MTLVANVKAASISYSSGPDGLVDDVNGDNVPDYYPTLYEGVFSPYNSQIAATATWALTFEPTTALANFGTYRALRISDPRFPVHLSRGVFEAAATRDGNPVRLDSLACAVFAYVPSGSRIARPPSSTRRRWPIFRA